MPLSKQQRTQLKLVHICPKKLRKSLLQKIDSSCIKAICECCLNTLKGNVPISKDQKKSLSRHRKVLRTLADRKVSLIKKRKLIIQKGGFLNILIPTVLSALGAVFNGIR